MVSLADATGDETQRTGHVEREAAILRRLQGLPQVVRLLEGPLYNDGCAFLVFRWDCTCLAAWNIAWASVVGTASL